MIDKENPDSLNYILENYEKQKAIDSEAGWEQLHKRISFDRNKRRFFNYLRNTAAILLPLFLVFQYALYPTFSENRLSEETITVSSAPGIVTKAVLPDGSEVWLNSLSSLTYPQRFTEKERTVQLTGEAFFKVVSDKKHRFNVEISSELDSKVTVALAVDEKAILHTSTGSINVVTADTYVETAWKDGKMVFRREKLDNIATRLSRKFGVDIVLEGEKLKGYEYTATFTDETFEDILDLLKRSAPIRYSISSQKKLENETYSRKKVTITSQ